MSGQNMMILVIVFVIIIGLIYYLNKNDDPIPNQGKITGSPMSQMSQMNQISQNGRIVDNFTPGPTMAPMTRASKNVVDDFVKSYQLSGRPMEAQTAQGIQGVDPYDNINGPFTGLPDKQQVNMTRIEMPLSPDEQKPDTFVYKKKNFAVQSQDYVKDLFDSQKLLPNPDEINNNWFDIQPLQNTKKIKGTHLINPKVHYGNDTVGGSLRNACLDLRGNIPVPKINVSIWNNSTIEPDTNLMGFSNPN